MIPPALATKSGAQTISRSASSTAIASAASWLLAAPGDHAAAQLADRLLVEHAAERARRDDVDVGAQRRLRVGPARAELVGQRLLAGVDVGDRELGARLGEQPRERAADAARGRSTETLRPASDALPSPRSQATSIAHSTPSAVHGLGSPELPRSTARPETWPVASAITAMSRSDVPTSSAVT